MPAMRDTGYDYISRVTGNAYPIMTRNGLPFIYDPKRELRLERKSVEAFMLTPARRQGSGLGVVPQAAFQVASAAANFIPGVGPFISAGIQILGSIFGGGDPTALSVLIDQIVQLREQIAEGNRALGRADDFTVPADFNAQDKKGHPGFVDGIVEAALNTTEDAIQENRRPDYYSAIAALKQQLQTIVQQAQQAQLAQTIEQQLESQGFGGGNGGNAGTAQGGTAAGGAAAAAGGGAIAPASSFDPSTLLLVAGVGGVAWYFLAGHRR